MQMVNYCKKSQRKTESISEAYQNVDDFHIITNDLSAQHQRLITKEAFYRRTFEIEIAQVIQHLLFLSG